MEDAEGTAVQRGSAVLLVTHDLRLLNDADRIWAIEDGRVKAWTESSGNVVQTH